jgi:MFS family permease
VKKILAALGLVLVFECALALCFISALQVPIPRNMPFGVTGSSPVVDAAETQKIDGNRVSFVNTRYANEADARKAIDQGKLYGAYIPGKKSDTLLTVPAKSFDALTVVEPLFVSAAAKAHQSLHVEQVKPLPHDKDPVGAVAGLLLLPTIVGGLVAALLLFKGTSTAAQRWRGAILIGFGLFSALLTDLIAGPLIGAYAGDRFWPLLACFALVTVTVAAVAAALLALFRSGVASVIALVLFIVLGLPSSGQIGSALLPTYWQAIGAALPPHYAADLFTKVLYFSSNNITTPIIVLAAYLVVAAILLNYREWLRPPAPAPAQVGDSEAKAPRRSRTVVIVVVLLVAALQQSLFALSFTSSAHAPSATKMPFAVTDSSPLIGAAEKNISLRVSHYENEAAAKRAIDQAKVYGALIPGKPLKLPPGVSSAQLSQAASKAPSTLTSAQLSEAALQVSSTVSSTQRAKAKAKLSSATSKLLVVPTRSDLAPLNLAVAFLKAGKAKDLPVKPVSYAPKPLPSGDPFGIVLGIVLTPLLLAGYLSSTLLRAARGVAAERWRGVSIIGFAVVSGLILDLIIGPWLNGAPSDKFWLMWPILALVTAAVGLFAAVMQKLVGAAGTFLTVLVIILLGKPSSGGANGVTYLPDFWQTIGPFLPPRNAYILLRNTIYFDGHGTAQALIVLLAYFVVFAVILGILSWRRRPEPDLGVGVDRETEAAAAAAAGVA